MNSTGKANIAGRLIDKLFRYHDALCGRSVTVMEICGTHTMAIARSGLRGLLPDGLRLISGPGCPVCVTDQSYMDQAVTLARRDDITVATYGDMVRVPGTLASLADARADGADVQVVYSADQAVDIALKNTSREVVFLGVGFETTAPATALAVQRAEVGSVENFSVLMAHKRLLPAMNALLADPNICVDGFLCPGHVSVILGYTVFDVIALKYGSPCVVAGFDAEQILLALCEIVRELAENSPRASSVYTSVTAEGNFVARQLLDELFEPVNSIWRGLGEIALSGMAIRERWSRFDAVKRFDLPEIKATESSDCQCGSVITGKISPRQCELFGRVCTPRKPIGPCMVSSEGACAAAFRYEKQC